jgi:hypothetical protein
MEEAAVEKHQEKQSVRQPDGDPGTEPVGGKAGSKDQAEGADTERQQPPQDERQGGYGGSTGGADPTRGGAGG